MMAETRPGPVHPGFWVYEWLVKKIFSDTPTCISNLDGLIYGRREALLLVGMTLHSRFLVRTWRYNFGVGEHGPTLQALAISDMTDADDVTNGSRARSLAHHPLINFRLSAPRNCGPRDR